MANAGISFTIDASRLEKKLHDYKANLVSVLRSEWAQILQECLLDIASRAPDPFAEQTMLMGGPFPTTTQVPPAHGRNKSAFPGGAGERVHFDRLPGMYVKEAILDPSTYTMDATNFALNLGIVSQLEERTKFSWVNYSRKTAPYSFPHTSEYGVWSFFEHGKSTVIHPRFWGGSKYKLKPYGAYPNPFWEWAIDKSYPRYGMYSDFDPSVLRKAIATRVRVVQF